MDELEQLEKNFKIYDKRIAEFKSYLEKASSKTQHELIKEALVISEVNFNLFADLLKNSVETLAVMDKKIKSRTDQTNIIVEGLKNKIDPIFNDPVLKKKFLPEYTKTDREISTQLVNLNVELLLFNVTTFLAKEFPRILFNCIYKPNNEQFKLDIILDLLKSIIMRIIPHADTFETINNLSVSKRKMDYSSSSNKFLIYIENYLKASELWQVYAKKYIEWLKTD
jgi:hypothetical protein